MPKLSYIITTYNKLSFLKEVVAHLLENKEDSDEIVITDGGSSDGTPDYLKELHQQKKIQAYLSQKDKGEAHGFNKALMLSTGEIIKVITDDDAFHYPAIRACKKFMVEHPEIDVIGGNTGGIDIGNSNSIYTAEGFQLDYIAWKEKKLDRFFFNGTCLMIRRSSVPLLGLFNTNVLLTDLEYTLRVTGNANIAWCQGLLSVRILNEQSNNLKFAERSAAEDKALCDFYQFKHRHVREAAKQNSKGRIYKARKTFSDFRYRLIHKPHDRLPTSPAPFPDFAAAHNFCLQWLKDHPLNKEIRFIH